MTPETLEALRGSIAKWKAIVETGDSHIPCALCEIFRKRNMRLDVPWSQECSGCPVSESGEDRHHCRNTPYDEWEDATDDEDEDRAAMAAQAELDFLISLLPAGAQP